MIIAVNFAMSDWNCCVCECVCVCVCVQNTDKCHLIVSSNDPTESQVGESVIKNTTCEKLRGIKIDYKLTFDEHISGLGKKAANRVTSYMSLPKKKLLLNSFFNAQFNYCPLVWMFHSRKMWKMVQSLCTTETFRHLR